MELLTVGEAATILHITKGTLYKWSQRGIIKSRKLNGSTLRFLPSDIEEFTNQSSTGVTQ